MNPKLVEEVAQDLIAELRRQMTPMPGPTDHFKSMDSGQIDFAPLAEASIRRCMAHFAKITPEKATPEIIERLCIWDPLGMDVADEDKAAVYGGIWDGMRSYLIDAIKREGGLT